MNKIKYISLFTAFFIISSCSNEDASNENVYSPNEYFNEFMACNPGPEMSPENLDTMISAWRELVDAEGLTGAWLYIPAADTNAFGDTGWWELQWDTKEVADIAWQTWVENESAAAWTEEYASVMECDGPGRNAFDGVFPIASEANGELPDTGYFYSEYYQCNYVEGSDRSNADAFLPNFTDAVNALDYSDTSYHFGNYFAHKNADGSHSETDIDFLWATFTNSEKSMKKVNELFEKDVREKMFPVFSEYAGCSETPDKYHGWTLYNRDDLEHKPVFVSD